MATPISLCVSPGRGARARRRVASRAYIRARPRAHMDNTVVKEIRDIGGRLDGVISFTIIRFIYAVCVVHLRPVEVVLFGGITGIVFSLVLHSRSISNATRIVSDLVRKVSLLVVAQASVAVLGVDATLQYTAASPTQYVLQSMTVVTCILILCTVVPQYFQKSELVQRCVLSLARVPRAPRSFHPLPYPFHSSAVLVSP